VARSPQRRVLADPEVLMAVRVFLVEDVKSMQELMRDTLESVGGFELVGTAATETAATDWLMRHRGEWDLAITDLLLAEGSGFTLITRCSREPEGGTTLVFSDFVTPVVRERCVRLGADRVISKAEFGELRAYLQAFPGRVPETAEEPA
jgi:DNA-binding NarL/FixJ family response regulator